jgi:hypothetical protein
VNGNEVAVREISGNIVGASGPLRIGGNGVWGEYFRGLIDEVRVYNRALTQTEIQADMETAVGANPEVSLAVFPQTADQIARDGFRLRLLATAPASYTIEYTTNLTTWQTLQTIQATNGPVEIVDPNANSSSVRLYRVRQP